MQHDSRRKINEDGQKEGCQVKEWGEVKCDSSEIRIGVPPLRCGALNGTVVVVIKPRLLIEHDLGDGLHLPGNADVSLDRDDAACNRDVAKLVPEAVGNDFFVVPEDNLVNEFLGAELPCMLKDKGPALVGEPSIVLVIHEVIVQDVESNINGYAAQVIHQEGEIMVRYDDFDARASDIHGERRNGSHFVDEVSEGKDADGNECGIVTGMNFWNDIFSNLNAPMNGIKPFIPFVLPTAPGIVARHASRPAVPINSSCLRINEMA